MTAEPMAKPEPEATISMALTGAGYVRVSLSRNPIGLYEVRARLNGVAAWLIVDTGAANTILAREGAARFCTELQQSDETAAGVESASAQHFATGKIDSVLLGRVRLRHVPILAISLDHVNDTIEAHGGRRADGLLGADLLRRRNAVIDFRTNSLFLESYTTALARLRREREASNASNG